MLSKAFRQKLLPNESYATKMAQNRRRRANAVKLTPQSY